MVKQQKADLNDIIRRIEKMKSEINDRRKQDARQANVNTVQAVVHPEILSVDAGYDPFE